MLLYIFCVKLSHPFERVSDKNKKVRVDLFCLVVSDILAHSSVEGVEQEAVCPTMLVRKQNQRNASTQLTFFLSLCVQSGTPQQQRCQPQLKDRSFLFSWPLETPSHRPRDMSPKCF